MEYEGSCQLPVASDQKDLAAGYSSLVTGHRSLVSGHWLLVTQKVWPVVSPPDAIWKAPYSARFHGGASVPGG